MTIKETKHWANKSEAATDEVRDLVEQGVDWLIARRREAAYAVGGAAAVALIVGLFLYGRRARANAAWDKLSQAELYAYSGRASEAQTVLAQIVADQGSRAATTLAYMLQGDLHYPHGEYDQAVAAYEKAAQDATEPLRPYAAADRVLALQAAGKSAECAAAARAFLDASPDHLLAAPVHVAMARCQLAQGQSEAAKATMQRISLQYPGTSWAQWASVQLQTPPK